MTYEELRKALKEGKAIASTSKDMSVFYIRKEGRDFVSRGKETDEYVGPYSLRLTAEEILKDNIPYEIYEKPILDKVERKYLSDVIRPFRKDYKITISKKSVIDAKEYLCISVKKIPSVFSEFILLPCFKKGSMYKGMERDKEYSLEELGL